MKIIKKIVSIMLAISLLLTAITPSFAAVPRTEGLGLELNMLQKYQHLIQTIMDKVLLLEG